MLAATLPKTFRNELVAIIEANDEMLNDPKAAKLIEDLKTAGLYGEATEDEIEALMTLGE